MKRLAGNVLDAVLILAAVVTTALALESRFGKDDPTDFGQPGVIEVEDWRGKPGYGRVLGPVNASKAVVVWSDYQCPACQLFEGEIRKVLARPNNDIKFVIKHLPMDFHNLAFEAAETSECAEKYGAGAAVHRALFDAKLKDGPFPFETVLATIPDSTASHILTCVQRDEMKEVVSADKRAAEQLGLQGTPSLQVGRKVITAALPMEELLSLVESEDGANVLAK